MNTTCLPHHFINKYQAHTAHYTNGKWAWCCQDMSVYCWQDLKKKSMRAVENFVCFSCGMIPTWQQKSELNCSVNNGKKCTKWLHCNAPIHSLFFNLCHAFTFKRVKWFTCNSTNKCWSQILMEDVVLFYSLEDIQFWFGLNAFACSLRMVGQCVSGKAKMWPIKACQSTEGRVKWCANTLLSLQWHYKWLPMGMLITQHRKEEGGVTEFGAGHEGRNQEAETQHNMTIFFLMPER